MLTAEQLEPYTMEIKNAAPYFGFHEKTIYAMVEKGELIFGTHFLKVGKKVLIKTKAFKQFLHDKSGVTYGGD
jgi:excisionase family DNA binding protein